MKSLWRRCAGILPGGLTLAVRMAFDHGREMELQYKTDLNTAALRLERIGELELAREVREVQASLR